MTRKLDGSVAIVTGASSGIGRATAKHLAAAGATVATVARRKDRLDVLVAEIISAGGSAFAVVADIADQQQAAQAVTQTAEQAGRIDILVNNAGYMILGALETTEPQSWEQMISVNQLGVLYMTRAALPHLRRAAQSDMRGGVADIVNISSLTGRIAMPNQSVYTMTKFAVNGFTESLRQELATSHVRVGALEPGVVESELTSHNTDPAVKKQIQDFAGTIRTLDPEDIAEGVTFMVTRPWHAAIGELWIMPTEEA
ncbi:SDR family NAD(P)-dependent oxidoreductase [Rhodococcus sp. WS1]|uniref:SDR family NAD(P)-dependent oxidoreductase n=1 Tax=unclassified Rhodococcus (in: high G+C Gram-positive bacteria) TaxID=192944 RepID=UPI0011411D54|nr:MULTISPECIES: SDR family NAD(P)-dependent oxidoreductase [unclassified Rhodococcus (in: high G+C Gram-positive bacteria)]ROZ53022.1 SDR family NAD(P)-dependent oxidoreductase [Rhodococcus sp. WS1]TQC35989.1 SDR family NAD(P)-dependent oxidoreductase [Rhodococcus sp. WS7]